MQKVQRVATAIVATAVCLGTGGRLRSIRRGNVFIR